MRRSVAPSSAQTVKKNIQTNNGSRIFLAQYNADAYFLIPKCPKNKEKDPNKLRIAEVSAGFGPFHDIGNEKNSKEFSINYSSLKINWAVCINSIKNVKSYHLIKASIAFPRCEH